jgi:hypothetical protein
VTRLRCWNHTINAVKAWLRKHGATSAEIPVYISQLRDMLNQSSMSEYEDKLQEFQVLWSVPFSQYYMTDIHPEVNIHIHLIVVHRQSLSYR